MSPAMLSLADLSTKQCTALFHSLEFHAFDEVFEQKEITGEDLSYVETEDDITELGIKVPKIQLKKIFHRIKAWQEQGVLLKVSSDIQDQSEVEELTIGTTKHTAIKTLIPSSSIASDEMKLNTNSLQCENINEGNMNDHRLSSEWNFEQMRKYFTEHSNYDQVKKMRLGDIKDMQEEIIKARKQYLVSMHLEIISLLLNTLKCFDIIEPELMPELLVLIELILEYCHEHISSQDNSDLSSITLRIIECNHSSFYTIKNGWRILAISGIPISAINFAFKVIRMYVDDLNMVHLILQSLQFSYWPTDIRKQHTLNVAYLLVEIYRMHEGSITFLNHTELQEQLQRLVIIIMSEVSFCEECIRVGGSNVLLDHLSTILHFRKEYVSKVIRLLDYILLNSKHSERIFYSIVNQNNFTNIEKFLQLTLENVEKELPDEMVIADTINFLKRFASEGGIEGKRIVFSGCNLFFNLLKVSKNNPKIVHAIVSLLSSISEIENAKYLMVYEAKALELCIELLENYAKNESIVIALFSLMAHILEPEENVDYFHLIPKHDSLLRCMTYYIQHYLICKFGFIIIRNILLNCRNGFYVFSTEQLLTLMTDAYVRYCKDEELAPMQLRCIKELLFILRKQSPSRIEVPALNMLKKLVESILRAFGTSVDSPKVIQMQLDILYFTIKLTTNASMLIKEELIDKGYMWTLCNVVKKYQHDTSIIHRLSLFFRDIASMPHVLYEFEKFKVQEDFVRYLERHLLHEELCTAITQTLEKYLILSPGLRSDFHRMNGWELLKVVKERYSLNKSITDSCDAMLNVLQLSARNEQLSTPLTTSSLEEGEERQIDEAKFKKRKLNPK